VNTFRMWDSGLRPTPLHVVTRAREVLASRAKRNELMPPIDWPRNWACISAHFRLRHAQADWRRNSRYAPLSDARSVPIALQANSSLPGVTAGSVVKPLVWLLCRPSPTTTMSGSETYAAGEGSPKTPWRAELAPPAKPLSTNGSRESEGRRPFYGNVSSKMKTTRQ
jgi:hypothetical protein